MLVLNVIYRFNRLAWSPHGGEAGVIAGGMEGGELNLWNVKSLLDGRYANFHLLTITIGFGIICLLTMDPLLCALQTAMLPSSRKLSIQVQFAGCHLTRSNQTLWHLLQETVR